MWLLHYLSAFCTIPNMAYLPQLLHGAAGRCVAIGLLSVQNIALLQVVVTEDHRIVGGFHRWLEPLKLFVEVNFRNGLQYFHVVVVFGFVCVHNVLQICQPSLHGHPQPIRLLRYGYIETVYLCHFLGNFTGNSLIAQLVCWQCACLLKWKIFSIRIGVWVCLCCVVYSDHLTILIWRSRYLPTFSIDSHTSHMHRNTHDSLTFTIFGAQIRNRHK